jgi:hypothetical protein
MEHRDCGGRGDFGVEQTWQPEVTVAMASSNTKVDETK